MINLSSRVQSDKAVHSGGIPFSFRHFLMDLANSSVNVDFIALSCRSSAMVRMKSLSGSMVINSSGSSFVMWSSQQESASAIISFASGMWVRVKLN